MDDTPTRERVRIQHGKSKNFIEMHPNGDQVVKVFGDNYEIIAKNNNVLIKARVLLSFNINGLIRKN
jgi:hypothetical protein